MQPTYLDWQRFAASMGMILRQQAVCSTEHFSPQIRQIKLTGSELMRTLSATAHLQASF